MRDAELTKKLNKMENRFEVKKGSDCTTAVKPK